MRDDLLPQLGIEQVYLLGRDLAVLFLEIGAEHPGNGHFLSDEVGHINRRLSFRELLLVSKEVLHDLEDLPLLLLLSVVQRRLDCQLFFLLLLPVLSAQLLSPSFGPSRMDAAAAPKADKNEYRASQDKNEVGQDPLSSRHVFVSLSSCTSSQAHQNRYCLHLNF